MRIVAWFVFAACSILPASGDEETREWKSVTGSTIRAAVISVEQGQVRLKSADGRQIIVPLEKLSETDRAYLQDRFPTNGNGGTRDGTDRRIADGLAHPVGKVVGPVEAGGGSTYFLYIPTTLREGRKAPLLHFNGSGGGNAGTVSKHIEGAELNGWIVVANVESRNGPDHPVRNHEHAKNTVRHAIETLPVDGNRVYFTGGSGGGAMSFYNATRIKSAGAMPHIGYIPQDSTPKSGHFFVISGTNDYNRYASANAVEEIGKNAIHRYFVGPHHEGPDWLCTEGMTWLNARYLIKNRRDAALADERADFESAVLAWCEKLAGSEPHRAYHWCDFLKNEFQVSSRNQTRCETLHRRLAGDPKNVAYAEGLKAVSEFSKRHFAGIGGAQFNHTTPKAEKAAEKLADTYAGVPMIEEIARALGKPTCDK